MATNGMRSIHPGEILREEFMAPLGLSAAALARNLSVPTNRVTGILNGERELTVDTALRLARLFGTTPEFWLDLQRAYDLRVAVKKIGRTIAREVTPLATKASASV